MSAQQINVLNSHTLEPIQGVALYNKEQSKNAVSIEDGSVPIDAFNSDELIYIKHLSFATKRIKKRNITTVIYLEPLTRGLDEIVISTSKFQQKKREIPQKVVSVSAKAIGFANPQTSADILSQSGQVFVQKSQLGGGSPMIRGFSTNRLLISVDGVRMNNAIFRGGNLQNVISIDPFSIAQTEVILGSGSVIYGSDAIGGVMSFHTKTPKLSHSDSLLFKAKANLRYASANQEQTGQLQLNFGSKKWGFLTTLSRSKFNDLRMGNHGPDAYLRPEFVSTVNATDVIVNNSNPKVQKQSGYTQFNLMQKVRYQPQSNLNIDLGVFYSSTSNIPRYDRLIRYNDDTLRSSEWHYGPQDWFMTNLQFTKLSSRSPYYDKIKGGVAYQNFKESRINRDFNALWRNTTSERLNAYTAYLDFEKQITQKTSLFYGAEYVFNKVFSKAYTQDISTAEKQASVTRYPDRASWQSAAAYLSFKYKPNTKFALQSGLRYNYIQYKASFTDNNVFLNLPFNSINNTNSALTGSFGIHWSPSTTLAWRLNASTAFRAPNIDDVGKVFDSAPGAVVVPNNNLKPETAYSGELGLQLTISPRLKFDFATYYTYLDNALVRRSYNLNGETQIDYNGELSDVQAIQNASKAWIYGFEAGLDLALTDALKLTSQYSIVGGTEEDANGTEVPVRHVSPSFGNTHIIWTKNAFKLDAFLEYNGSLEYADLAMSEREKAYLYTLDNNGNPYSPSWITANLRTSYKLSTQATLRLAVENIFDRRYRPYSSGISAPGRNVIASLQYNL